MLPTLRIKVLLDGAPARGLFVAVRLAARRKNDFKLVFGPTRDDGMLVISRADILRDAGLEKTLFPADYGDPELDFAGAITVEPLNFQAVADALGAYEKFKDVSQYPPGYARHLRESSQVLAAKLGKLLSVSVTVEGDEAAIIEKAAHV